MGRAPTGGATAFRFTQREVAEMEKALDSSKGSTPARAVVLSLADNFSASEERAGQKVIQWKQVWNWFQNRRHSQKAKIGKTPEKFKAPADVTTTAASAPDPLQPRKVPGSSGAVTSGAKFRIDSQQMEFEAKSARDGAWYDVATFISHRVTASTDPEVRVRFAGFGSEEDEWVNVRSAVRQRSLPCEASECVAVLPGDLILCFQEGNEQALYFDADILDVQRRRHDVRGCRCRFWVRYRHDQAEEVVPLRKVCRRPETEYRLQKLQLFGKSAVTSADGQQQQQSANINESAAPLGHESIVPTTTPGVTTTTNSDARNPCPAASALAAAVVPSLHSSLSTGTTELSTVPGVPAAPAGTITVPAVPVAGSSIAGGASPVSTPALTSALDFITVEGGPIPDSSETKPGSIQNAEEDVMNQGTNDSVGPGVPDASVDDIMVKVKQDPLTEQPSLLAQPEMFDDKTESIVVLGKSDLEGVNKL